MKYYETLIVSNSELAGLLVEQLQPFAEDQSVIQEQLGDPDNLEAKAMLPDIAVKFWFSQDKDSPHFRAAINKIVSDVGCSPAEFTLLDSIDWTTEWRKNYQPIPVGDSFIIMPPWGDNPEPNRTPIFIDPGIAFGTGQHETTRLCIDQLEKQLQPGMRLLDIGAGSAILSIAANHLGAEHVTAVEIDADAIGSAEENLKLNQISSGIDLIQGSLKKVQGQTWDLVVANILAVILIELIQYEGLLKTVKRGGRIIFSGIIDQQQRMFIESIDQTNYEIEEITAEGEWICITVRRL